MPVRWVTLPAFASLLAPCPAAITPPGSESERLSSNDSRIGAVDTHMPSFSGDVALCNQPAMRVMMARQNGEILRPSRRADARPDQSKRRYRAPAARGRSREAGRRTDERSHLLTGHGHRGRVLGGCVLLRRTELMPCPGLLATGAAVTGDGGACLGIIAQADTARREPVREAGWVICAAVSPDGKRHFQVLSFPSGVRTRRAVIKSASSARSVLLGT
jgi:hypothetical protein